MQTKVPETTEVQTISLGHDHDSDGASAAETVKPGPKAAEGDDLLAQAIETLSSAHGAHKGSPRAGVSKAAAPVYAGGYTYWNLYAAGPYQFPFGDAITAPNLRPSKVASVGETVTFYVNIWANPAFDPAGMNNGPAQLAGHELQLSMQVNNLTTMSVETSSSGTVGKGGSLIDYDINLWPENSLVRFDFVAPNVGPRPEMMEAMFTVDMVGTALPYAGYVTHVWDPDRDSPVPVPYIDISEPGNPVLLGDIPAVTPGWRFEIPLRFLVADPNN